MSTIAPTKTKSPEEELEELKEHASQLGMSEVELTAIESIGTCSEQIQQQIVAVRAWIAKKCE